MAVILAPLMKCIILYVQHMHSGSHSVIMWYVTHISEIARLVQQLSGHYGSSTCATCDPGGVSLSRRFVIRL